jgi:hypothetical protein
MVGFGEGLRATRSLDFGLISRESLSAEIFALFLFFFHFCFNLSLRSAAVSGQDGWAR